MTESNNLDAAKLMLAAHKQSLQLLDQRIATVQKLITADEELERLPDYPYFYAAMGEDGLDGIPLFPGPNREYTGKIEVQADAPFVWTHIQACLRYTNPLALGPSSFVSIWGGADSRDERYPPSVSLGFVEEGSGRVLFQSDRREVGVGGNNVDTSLISGNLFDVVNVHDMDDVGTTTGWSAGNGPLTVMNLAKDVLLPENDVVTVRARPSYVERFGEDPDARLYVTLLGYKIFGE
jgi:hypothetical protein